MRISPGPAQLADLRPHLAQLGGLLSAHAGPLPGTDLGLADSLRSVSADPIPSRLATAQIVGQTEG